MVKGLFFKYLVPMLRRWNEKKKTPSCTIFYPTLSIGTRRTAGDKILDKVNVGNKVFYSSNEAKNLLIDIEEILKIIGKIRLSRTERNS